MEWKEKKTIIKKFLETVMENDDLKQQFNSAKERLKAPIADSQQFYVRSYMNILKEIAEDRSRPYWVDAGAGRDPAKGPYLITPKKIILEDEDSDKKAPKNPAAAAQGKDKHHMSILTKIFHKEPKTPEQQLFNAIRRFKTNKVRELLEAGVDPNTKTGDGRTPLDFCTDILDSYVPSYDLGPNSFNNLANLSRIWRDLVKSGGRLDKYDDDDSYHEDRTLNRTHTSKYGTSSTPFATFIAIPKILSPEAQAKEDRLKSILDKSAAGERLTKD